MSTKSIASLPSVTSEGGLGRYLQQIRQFPMLQPDEEYMLAKRWREHGDREAAHRLVTSHLGWSPKSPWAIAAMGCRSRK